MKTVNWLNLDTFKYVIEYISRDWRLLPQFPRSTKESSHGFLVFHLPCPSQVYLLVLPPLLFIPLKLVALLLLFGVG